MRTWTELDGESAGWGPARARITELTNAGYAVDEYIRGDHCKDLMIRGGRDQGGNRP
jgi:hypothetical protein